MWKWFGIMKILDKLVSEWRKAENQYILTGDDTMKNKVKDYQDSLNLSQEELKYVNDNCYSLGI